MAVVTRECCKAAGNRGKSRHKNCTKRRLPKRSASDNGHVHHKTGPQSGAQNLANANYTDLEKLLKSETRGGCGKTQSSLEDRDSTVENQPSLREVLELGTML